MSGNKKRSSRTKKKKKEKKKRRLRGVAQLLAQNKVADDLSRRNLPQSIATNAHDKPRGGKGIRRYCEGGISSTYFRDTVIPDQRLRSGFPNKHQTNTKLGLRPRNKTAEENINQIKEARKTAPLSPMEKARIVFERERQKLTSTSGRKARTQDKDGNRLDQPAYQGQAAVNMGISSISGLDRRLSRIANRAMSMSEVIATVSEGQYGVFPKNSTTKYTIKKGSLRIIPPGSLLEKKFMRHAKSNPFQNNANKAAAWSKKNPEHAMSEATFGRTIKKYQIQQG